MISAILSLSRRAHNALYRDANQSLCARAYYKQQTDWRWRLFRIAADALFRVFERPHCRRSFDRYY